MTWHRNYEAIIATPMRVVDLVLGELAWIAVRLTMIALAFILRDDRVRHSAFAAGVAGGARRGADRAGLCGADHGVRRDAEDVGNFNVLFRFVITPLFLFSGVFFPITRLPEPLARAAWFTPLFHGVELVRGLTPGLARRQAWIVHVAVSRARSPREAAALAVRTFRRRLYA